MTQVGFELTIPASERPQTHALNRAASGIGSGKSCRFRLAIVIIMNYAFLTMNHYVDTSLYCENYRSCNMSVQILKISHEQHRNKAIIYVIINTMTGCTLKFFDNGVTCESTLICF
jgi:hypothetical protein